MITFKTEVCALVLLVNCNIMTTASRRRILQLSVFIAVNAVAATSRLATGPGLNADK